MAFIKEREINCSGITGNYWKFVFYNSHNVSATFALYLSKEARLAGKQPLDQISFQVNTVDESLQDTVVSTFATIENAFKKVIYKQFKKHEYFSDSQDDV